MDKKLYQVMPELSAEEYERLKEDIKENGIATPIDVDEDGNILDGHHRAQICEELGIECPTRTCFNLTEEEKYEYALRVNINRRQLSGEQLQEVILKFKEDHPTFSSHRIAKATGIGQQAVASVINGKEEWSGDETRHVTTVEGSDGKTYPASKNEAETKRAAVREAIVNDPSKTDREIARETGTSHVTVGAQRKKMKTVTNPSKRDQEALKDPDIRRRMVENEGLTVAGAIREQKRDQLVEHLEDIAVKEAKAAKGIYDVVVIDPPWEVGEIKADVRASFVGRQYPTMSLKEIKEIKIPAADNCHLFLWTTQRFLPDAFDVLKEWGAKYVCTFVWDKGHDGFLPFGLPRYNCEFCLYAHIGSPKFIDQKAFYCCFNAPTTGNSEKPDAFYDMIRRVTAGRRLDMFNRREIEGFDGWGKEAADNKCSDSSEAVPRNASMNRAKEQKNNEFYTRLNDIEAEIIKSGCYNGCFQDKVVLCNCNDLTKGDFMQFFMDHFEDLGLKRLITVSYGDKAAVASYDGHSTKHIPLAGDGDFRSDEGIKIIQHADVVVTNPPFTLFREFLLMMVKYEKQFLIVGDVINKATCKNVFPLYIDGLIWFGSNKIEYFQTPEDGLHKISYNGWYTNIGNPNPPKQLNLTKQYFGHETDYPVYDNYAAISVNKCKDIPIDYYGKMGVPSSYLQYHDPTRFDIIGTSEALAEPVILADGKIRQHPGRFYIGGHRLYERVVIRRRV